MVQKTKRSILWNPQNKKLQSKTNLLEGRRRYTGIHLIAEFWYGKNIENPKELKKILLEAAKKANNTPLEVLIHKFSPQGITGVILLAESHIAIHAWPEFNYLAIDIFTCGKKAMPYKALRYLEKEFKPKKVEIREIKRGKKYALRERFKKII
jgi:S-adenosylmethionine decarboxylase proenzyme